MFVTVSSLYTNNFCITLQHYMSYFKEMKKELIQKLFESTLLSTLSL
ncbi:hypothetical protein BCA_0224 [Bacillus cereus 03BB102]|uniref:Uncharacterized protein n=1 Tax=Bacillus cereus (strain 03BB102) TaxID=572264 RepID=A0A158RJ53_BACC3|nr:hypothetical protein BCA_0224 [Bacillus cereus 03BB102]